MLVTLILGYVSSTPYTKYYYDATYTKSNTLAKESQDVIKNLDGDLTITTYVNLMDEDLFSGLPRNRNNDFKRI